MKAEQSKIMFHISTLEPFRTLHKLQSLCLNIAGDLGGLNKTKPKKHLKFLENENEVSSVKIGVE